METQNCILGGGMTGLAAGWASGLPVFEAEESPGGICSSYYVCPQDRQRLAIPPADGEAYRFEIGGGHWIFGGDPAVLRFIRALTPVNCYERRSSVFFPEQDLYVPYPLQNHLGYLAEDIRKKALAEILSPPQGKPRTMEEWLNQSFGRTLTELFFGPFHESYTAGLWRLISPQDAYKSPVDTSLVTRGASEATPPVGYNVTYLYPELGLNTLARRMADRCQIYFGKRVVKIDVQRKGVQFADGTMQAYDLLLCTLPLNKTMELAGLEVSERPDPYTSVLVLNIGATRGRRCPQDHWVYVPRSGPGFHRVGFYSNVDPSFLPKASRAGGNRVSIYVERVYVGGQKPQEDEIRNYSHQTVRELEAWGFIEQAEVVDPTWIDVAYTWSWPGSQWRSQALRLLEEYDVIMTGRYGRWIFQGIADSLRDGFFVGGSLRA